MPVLTPELRQEADRIKARYPAGRERSAMMPLLYLMQSVEGRVTRDGLREVAEILGVTTAEVEAVATFYTMIRPRPTGTHVLSVCTNLSCALRGANEVYARAHQVLGPGSEDATEDGLFSLHEEECLGACDAAPVVQLNYVNFDRVTPDGVAELIDALRRGETPVPSRGTVPPDFKAASRILAGLGGPGGSRSEREGASDSPPGGLGGPGQEGGRSEETR
jgi:NADH-quinone oxidoreductase subunit E